MQLEKQKTKDQRLETSHRRGGMTLIEVIIYIALFSFMAATLIGGAFLLINSTQQTRQTFTLEREANFLTRKIGWALSGDVFDVSEPEDGVLFVDKTTNPNYTFKVNRYTLELNDIALSAEQVIVDDFDVTIIPANPPLPKRVEVRFVLNDVPFATTTHTVR